MTERSPNGGWRRSYREIPENRVLRFSGTPGFKGWKDYFTDESTKHPAKMNLKLLRWILKKYTKTGDTILDPMAGTGSTAILASLLGRHGVAVEFEPQFCKMIEENISRTRIQSSLDSKGSMVCYHGDARKLSKLLEESDAIVTSPPYGNRLSDVAVHDGDPARIGYRQTIDTILTSPPYGSDNANLMGRTDKSAKSILATTGIRSIPLAEDNIGNLEDEAYFKAMLQVYHECHKVLAPGGVMILVTKNFIRDKTVIRLDLDTIEICEAAGFRLLDHWYFKLPIISVWINIYRIKYPDTPKINYEDVLVFKKESEK